MIVLLLAFSTFNYAASNLNDPNTQMEKYNDKIKYQLDVPGKEPITIIETQPISSSSRKWDASEDISEKDAEIKNLMTHIVHDFNGNRPRCYGPSCQEGFDPNEGPQDGTEDILITDNLDKLRDYRDFSKDRLEAISALVAKLKKDKLNGNRYTNEENTEEDNGGKVFTSWNRLKVKQHKHPFDDKNGWVTLEPIAWSTSKISKWKPNVKKQKPNSWDNDDDNFSSDPINTSQGMEINFHYPQKKPSLSRPGFINNKLHLPSDYDTELPSKPTWTRPQQSVTNFQSWAPDESRRPNHHNCDNNDNYQSEDSGYYDVSDSIVTDTRPSKFPYDYEALHQSTVQKRPYRKPAVYSSISDEDDLSSRPPYGDGQWVLLSTTKGYRNKKRQRSLNPTASDGDDTENLVSPMITAHKTVALTVLPSDNSNTNMTTSHGGLLEVERSFQTVEESKIDMDKKNDLDTTQSKPVRNKILKKKVVPSNSPDSSTVFAAVGAGMLPATMAMVVPMMLGRRRRRRDLFEITQPLDINDYFRVYRNE